MLYEEGKWRALPFIGPRLHAGSLSSAGVQPDNRISQRREELELGCPSVPSSFLVWAFDIISEEAIRCRKEIYGAEREITVKIRRLK